MEPPVEPDDAELLPLPDIDRLEEVKELFSASSAAYDNDNYVDFVHRLAEAFCLDIHDFTMVMKNGEQHMRRACSCVALLGENGNDSPQFHTLKMAMALVDCSGFVYENGVVFTDHSQNYVIRKWTHALPSTIRLLRCLDGGDGTITSLPHLEYWKVLQLFGILANCLGNIDLALRCFHKVRLLADNNKADSASITEIDRDIRGLELYPANTCCVCLAVDATKCGVCGISCYCSKRCQREDWKDQHRNICASLVGWKEVVFKP
jgi:hypothetical protein